MVDNLRDPELTPASFILQRRSPPVDPLPPRTIFSVSGEKISAYILRRRLEECARQMCNPRMARAYADRGLPFPRVCNSAAHFTRCFGESFRRRAPRDYRRSSFEERRVGDLPK